MKIAIFFDSLVNKGGIEREILTLTKYFDVTIFTGIYQKDLTFKEFRKIKIIEFKDAKKLPQRIRSLYLRHRFSKLKLKGFDFYISFGGASLNALINHKPNFWYCNAPSRWMYDLYEEELKKLRFPKKSIFKLIVKLLKINDQELVKKYCQRILVNSKNVQRRITRFYGLKSYVAYPPTDTKTFNYIGQKDYYFSSGRLDPIKRVGLIVKAFQKMPDKKLIIVGGGPDEKNIRKLSENYSNIEVKGWTENKELKELYGNCIASLYLSYKEDFGLIPVESMSAGKPCIATNDGGFKETIIHKKTGYLVDNPKNTEEVIKAVNWLTKKKALSMKKDCEERAKLFNEEKFIKEIKKHIKEVSNI